MAPGKSFNMKLAQECAQAFSAAFGVGCLVTDAQGRAYYEQGYRCV